MNTYYLKLVNVGVRHLAPYVPGKPAETLQREFGLTNIVKLASNENPLGANPKVITAIQAALPELTRYPDGSGFSLKAALSVKLGVSPEQLILGNGSSEILELAVRTFVSPELEVVFSRHAFALYPILTQAVGASAKVAPAKEYGHDLQAMAEQITEKTRLVFIANPNNPTGTRLENRQLENFIRALPSHVLCVLDEAYVDFVPGVSLNESLVWLQSCPNLIVARTFSKAYGLAGLRIGYGIASAEIADYLNRVRPPFNNNIVALAAAEAALADTEYLQRTVKLNNAGMRQLTEALAAMKLRWIPSAGNFVTFELNTPALPVYEALLREGVIVRPIANYDMPMHLRVSVGSVDENRVFIEALDKVLGRV